MGKRKLQGNGADVAAAEKLMRDVSRKLVAKIAKVARPRLTANRLRTAVHFITEETVSAARKATWHVTNDSGPWPTPERVYKTAGRSLFHLDVGCGCHLFTTKAFASKHTEAQFLAIENYYRAYFAETNAADDWQAKDAKIHLRCAARLLKALLPKFRIDFDGGSTIDDMVRSVLE